MESDVEGSPKYDLIIAGAGPVGCVIAEHAARLLNWKVLIVEKRGHIAGNCYDAPDEHGVLLHRYGPHYFRTNNPDLIAYLSSFTDWVPGNYVVKASVNGALYPFPINLTTLEQFFDCSLDEKSAQELLAGRRLETADPKNSEEFVLSRVGRELYEAFYLGYTQKQWNRHPRDLLPSVCGRIPVRLNRDERYVDHTHQLTPAGGFTAMFARMISHPNIEVRLDFDYLANKDNLRPRVATVYTGPIDAYFGYCHGRLDWRSLNFVNKHHKEQFIQPCVQINYPGSEPYTRSVEIKHVTGQKIRGTTVVYEYPSDTGEPYYPVPSAENKSMYLQYKALSERESKENSVYFVGRLAQYTYINTDEAIEMAIAAFESIRQRYQDAAPKISRLMERRSGDADRLSVVMPVYNEEKRVGPVIDEWMSHLRQVTSNFELLVINDGSRDATLKVLEASAGRYPELRIISKANAGHGQACLDGYRAALEGGADWIFQIDSDGQCDPRHFPEFWRQRHDADAIYGRRKNREDGRARQVISQVLAVVVFLRVGIFVPDSNVPYRLMRRSALKPLVDRISSDFYLANIAVAVAQVKFFKVVWSEISFRAASNEPRRIDIRYFIRQAKALWSNLRALNGSLLKSEIFPEVDAENADRVA